MTKTAYKTKDNKLVILNTKHDECLHSDRYIAGREQNRYKEIYVHITKHNNTKVFYIVNVTYWQGERNTIKVLSENEVQSWITDYYNNLDEDALKKLAQLGFEITETA